MSLWFWAFAGSLLVNVLGMLYVRWLLSMIASINLDIEELSVMLGEYSKHLESIHELEMFYGDDTLKSLMEHGKRLSERLEGLDLILNQDKMGEEEQVAEEKKEN